MEPDSLAQIYDGFAATYARKRDAFDLSGVLADFATDLPLTGDLCDLGCGTGEPVSAMFVARGWCVTGVDFSAGMLELASQFVPEVTTVLADIRDAEFDADSFDAVTAVYSLFHIPWRDHPRIFARVAGWLRPGGRFLFTYALRDYTGQDEFNGNKEFLGQELFYSHTTPDRMGAQLTAAGLVISDERRRTIGGETFLWVTAARPPR